MAAFSHFCFFLIIIWVCFNLATNLGRQHASAFKMLLVQFLLIFWLLSTTHDTTLISCLTEILGVAQLNLELSVSLVSVSFRTSDHGVPAVSCQHFTLYTYCSVRLKL